MNRTNEAIDISTIFKKNNMQKNQICAELQHTGAGAYSQQGEYQQLLKIICQ